MKQALLEALAFLPGAALYLCGAILRIHTLFVTSCSGTKVLRTKGSLTGFLPVDYAVSCGLLSVISRATLLGGGLISYKVFVSYNNFVWN